MNREEILYLVSYLFSLALTLGIFIYTWRHRHVRGARMYSWFLAGQTLSILGFIFELVSPNLQTKLLWDKFQWLTYSFLVFIPFLIFAVQFSEHKLRAPRLAWGFWIGAPLLFTLLLITDDLHHLIYPNPGLSTDYPFPELTYDFTSVVLVYSVLYIYGANIFGISLLIRRALQPYNLYKFQYWVIAIGFLIPLVLSVFTLLDIRIAPQRDLSPFSLAVGNVVVAWGLFRYGLFDIVPIARDHIVENMVDPVVVLDARNRVVDMNPAALEVLGKPAADVIGRPSNEVFAAWPIIVSELEYLDTDQKEIAIKESDDTFFYDLNISSMYNSRRQLIGRIIVARDITKHKTLEVGYRFLSEELEQRVQERTSELHHSLERYRAVVENQTEFIVRWRPNGIRTFVNEAYCRYFGVTLEQALSSGFMPLIVEEDRPAVEAKVARLLSGESAFETEVHRIIKPDGRSIGWQEWTDQVICDENGRIVELQSVGRDVTARKQAEDTILKQLAFDELLNRLLVRFATCSHDEVDESIQSALREVTEYLGADYANILLLSDDHQAWTSSHRWMIGDSAQTGQPTQTIPSGKLLWSENRLLHGEPVRINSLDEYPPEAGEERKLGEADGVKSLLSVPMHGRAQPVFGVIDIVSYHRQIEWSDTDVSHLQLIGDAIANLLERQRAEDALRKSEERFSKAFQSSPVVIMIVTLHTGTVLEVNEAFVRIFGHSHEDAIGKTSAELGFWGNRADREQNLHKYIRNGMLKNEEVHLRTKSGEEIIGLFSAEPIMLGSEECAILVIEDITERKRAEARILRLNRLYVTISQINQTIVHARDKDSLFDQICRVATDHGQFRMAWIGLVDETSNEVNPVVFAGEEQGFLKDLKINLDELVVGSEPTGTAIRENRCIICQDIADDPRTVPWRDRALARGYRSSAAVPIREQGRVVGVLKVYASEPHGFDAEDEELLEQIGLDISFALDSLNAEHQRRQAEESLVEAYDTTLEGWAKALELRDKETEGHSRRVTESTLIVARALGIPEAELEHIHRGAILHDIGKMGIPDDILRKNGPLTAEERTVVERHPVTAFNLLKRIPYLEKALDIPYCHHEKWDGSGYPRGLKGEAIPLAARIFAVADVWDALTSDRPYREAWDRAKATQYLVHESGKHFDPTVVKVFLGLIEKGEI